MARTRRKKKRKLKRRDPNALGALMKKAGRHRDRKKEENKRKCRKGERYAQEDRH